MLAVMDRLAALEAAWHAGHFLPQSVYTCLYMLLPDRYAGACNTLEGGLNTLLFIWVVDDRPALRVDKSYMR